MNNTIKNHIKQVETYINGNISDFKEYLKTLNQYELLELLEVFINYGYSIKKLKWIIERI